MSAREPWPTHGHGDVNTETPAAFETYSWSGTDAKGVAHMGRTGFTLAQIAQVTENYYRQGWQSLRVARSWEVPDAGTPDLVAMIGPHPGTGERVWWAEGETDDGR
jgi:hypothetical protein